MNIFVAILYILGMSIMLYWQSGIFVSQYYSARRMIIIEKQNFQNLRTNLVQKIKLIVLTSAFIVAIFSFICAEIILLIILPITQIITSRIKQKFTRRKTTLLAFSVLFSMILGAFAYYSNEIIGLIIMSTTSYFPITILIICNFLLWPLENMIRRHYIKQAQQKIKLNSKLKTIAITGSYGKTSFKRYLHTILSKKYITLRSPGSVNTVMGLTKFINNELSPYDEYLILEFGVDARGGMDKLLKFIQPNYGVITAIGPMHLATFKSLENIRYEKMKLAHGLRKEKVLFYNEDSIKLSNNEILPCSAFKYSLDEIKIKNVSIYGTTIVLGDNREYLVPLLGKHQVLNCWGAIKMAMYFGMSFEEITRALAYISPEEHRLSIEQRKNRIIIDDSYNSNQEGMTESINVVLKLPGKKAIITPGIIEVGNLSSKINMEIGRELVNFDMVYIVSDDKNPALLKGYLNASGNTKNIKIFPSFIEAYNASKKLEIDILLISNDAHKVHIK